MSELEKLQQDIDRKEAEMQAAVDDEDYELADEINTQQERLVQQQTELQAQLEKWRAAGGHLEPETQPEPAPEELEPEPELEPERELDELIRSGVLESRRRWKPSLI